ncbi:MAG TPA: LytR C-terminal domain-containing protein [Acidimicrobiales bacterium]|nr:LytR C-terminal domain-containing protein [Acidimicrobiales bacterium]
MPDGEDAEAPRRAGPPIRTVRAGVVVGCFLVALVLLLGPASNRTASAPTTSTTHPPAPVVKSKTSVQVVNGTVVAGAAHGVAEDLGKQGWDALAPENLNPVATKATQSTATYVYFLPGHQYAADLVAAVLGVPVGNVKLRSRAVIDTVAGAPRDDVVVILGTGLAR